MGRGGGGGGMTLQGSVLSFSLSSQKPGTFFPDLIMPYFVSYCTSK